jgi:hypothetical protein
LQLVELLKELVGAELAIHLRMVVKNLALRREVINIYKGTPPPSLVMKT